MLRLAPAALLVLSGALLAACTEQAPPLQTREQIEASRPSPTESQGPGEWQDDFTEQQLDEYAAAQARWDAYQEASAGFFRDGEASEESLAVFEEYFYQADVMQQTLESYQARGLKLIGEVQVLWSRAASVDTEGDTVTIVVEECINLARTSVIEGGVTNPAPYREPILRTITLASVDGAEHQVFAYEGPEGGDAEPCDP